MPELPEVETVVCTLRPHVVGEKIKSVQLLRPDIVVPSETDLAAHLTGRSITAIHRRGKRIVFTLDNANGFYIHLGMTGRLTIETRDSPVTRHTHLILNLAGAQIRFTDPRRFGGIWWLGTRCTGDDRMGPEPLTLKPAQLAAALAKTRRAVKSALLDQTLIAGLGNIYVDEALFGAQIHPLARSDRLKAAQVGALLRAIKRVLRKAINHRGSTLRDYRDAAGNSGSFQDLHRVYDRKGQPCRVCRTAIERIVLGGRSTHFCPKCQRPSAHKAL
jgi:formamidopyrimidine-DNA glycosylase